MKKAQYDREQQPELRPPTFVYDDEMNEVVIGLYWDLLRGYEGREFIDQDRWNTLYFAVLGGVVGGAHGWTTGGNMGVNGLAPFSAQFFLLQYQF
mmetsp:Transcript_12694/g.19478  ORF Transcript_12694/g.19478 Transcript_12694/m.19478 type:complete len:95 (-) Transcript_12694:63-347(-)